eukprot:TRINITY_DN6551_c0_g1_i1.p1 TRINITY_DN6551_c0_g1~~TRINITY_DN6551_c0_g1_i1.p1  ORF type:complete len:106 (+),score=26.93 TRINITY_DN6551_c0_g1_i1:207-524(+)
MYQQQTQMHAQKAQQRTTVIHLEDKGDVDANIVQEGNQEFVELADELRTLKETFSDLRDIVGEQGEVLKVTEANTVESNMKTMQAVQELKEAEKLAPCCCCCVVQ